MLTLWQKLLLNFKGAGLFYLVSRPSPRRRHHDQPARVGGCRSESPVTLLGGRRLRRLRGVELKKSLNFNGTFRRKNVHLRIAIRKCSLKVNRSFTAQQTKVYNMGLEKMELEALKDMRVFF